MELCWRVNAIEVLVSRPSSSQAWAACSSTLLSLSNDSAATTAVTRPETLLMTTNPDMTTKNRFKYNSLPRETPACALLPFSVVLGRDTLT